MNFFKSIFLVLLLCLMGEATAFAVPAYTKTRKVIQPDGSVLSIVGRGDEFCHFLTTTDGYTVVKGNDGFYRYADLKEGKLVASGVRAYDADKRVSSEINYLCHKEKFLTPEMGVAERSLKANAMQRSGFAVKKNLHKVAGKSKNFRGLLLLVNFNDCQFSRGNKMANFFYDSMMNEEGFSSYSDMYFGKQSYTGSVRDYFKDNSYGQFVPDFDVVGPVDLDISQYYINCVSKTYEVAEMALKAADGKVDFSKYDSDGDGEVDMVYLLYAGYSSNYSGNDARLVWPHAASMQDQESTGKNLKLDGMSMGRFACSAEIFGWQDDKDLMLDGIGVIVHEFSHTLGFMDHYDTSNGYQEHPNTWDVMSAGNYSEDCNRTPVAFNSFEKYVAGFIKPTNITEMGGKSISLESTETSTDACMLRSYQDDVFFMMENRQKDKWDKYLPGHGLLVWRVDSTNAQYWTQNAINVTTRACFRLVRACGTQGDFLIGVEDTDFDSFPGTHHITELDNDDDDANLISYDGYPCPVVLRNISEMSKVISFDIEKDEYARNQRITYELPSKLTVNAEKLEGEEWVPATWTVTTGTEDNNNIIRNLIPNTVGITSTAKDYSKGVYVAYTYNTDVAHTITINAQRVALADDYGTWLCDLNDVNNSGAGAMTLSVGRYGVPAFNDPATMLSYITLKPKAYVVVSKNLIDQLVVYRNVTFSDYTDGDADDIIGVASNQAENKAQKVLEDNRLLILKAGKKYTTTGILMR